MNIDSRASSTVRCARIASAGASDAADDLCAEVRLRRSAGDERRRGADVGRIDLERRRAEEDEAAAAFEHGDVAEAGAQRFERDAPQFADLRGRDRFIEPLGFDRDRDVARGERDAARGRIVFRFDRIVVGARDQAIPKRFAPVLAAAGIARKFDGDRGRR